MRGLVGIFIAAMALAFGAIAPPPARAWGKFGHLTVCDLAYRNLTPTARAAVVDILRSRSGGITVPPHGKVAARHYTSFNVGCLEEDELPRRSPDDHFVNLDRSTAAIVDDACPPAAAHGECILAGLRRELAILRDPASPRRARATALMAVGHYVGDIHQPLHVSFADDRGGNGIDIDLEGRCGTGKARPDNLHAVWDNCLLEAGLFERVRQRADFKRTWQPRTITYRAVDSLQAGTGLAEESRIVSGAPWQWAQESYVVTRAADTGYCVTVGPTCRYSTDAEALAPRAPHRVQVVEQAYLARFAPVAQERIRRAGFRLAHLLNQALDPAYDGPVRDARQPA